MKRIRLISIVVAVILLGGLAIAVYRDKEPRYQGRTLTEWFHIAESASETDRDWQNASHAVKQMAPEAIPLLLKDVQAKDSAFKGKMIYWLRENPVINFKIKSADDRRRTVALGFKLLGNEARPVWPVLIQWSFGTNRVDRFWALEFLVQSRPDKETLLPVLIRLIHDQDPSARFHAASICAWLYPQDAEANGVYKMIPLLKTPSTNTTGTHQIRGK
jgi:hypothetical protein